VDNRCKIEPQHLEYRKGLNRDQPIDPSLVSYSFHTRILRVFRFFDLPSFLGILQHPHLHEIHVLAQKFEQHYIRGFATNLQGGGSLALRFDWQL